MSRIHATALLLLASMGLVRADGMIIFPLPYPTPLTVKFHKVTCTIDNGVATTVVDQVFVNNTRDELAGGRYVFPVPKGAVVGRFDAVVDGVVRQATVMSQAQAQQFFEEAVRTSTQASLLQYTQNEAYALQLANIPAAGTRRVQISYVEVLPKKDGVTRYLYPLNTEKFSRELIDTVTLDVTIRNASPITSVFSPSHTVRVERMDRQNVTAHYASYASRPNTDFELAYKLSDDDISFHLFTYKEASADGYFLMLITPQFATAAERVVAAKDMAFTIDRSGSMGGTKLRQARDGLANCLTRLMPEDSFDIVTFETAVTTFTPCLVPATSTNVQQALVYARAIAEAGMTNIAGAMQTTLGLMHESSRPHYCIFLTDGLPTQGVTKVDSILAIARTANTSGTRIYSVGFGYDVNTVLLDQISGQSGGYAFYCDPSQSIEEVITTLYRRIESPIMVLPVLTIPTVQTYAVSPAKLPDLFSGGEIAVYGRYRNEGGSVVELSGQTATGSRTLTYQAYFPNEHTDYAFVPRLWAAQQIARLMARIKVTSSAAAEYKPLVDSVTTLSITYGIVTPFTSAIFQGSTAPSGPTWDRAIQAPMGAQANYTSNALQDMSANTNGAQTVAADTARESYMVAPQVSQVQNAGQKVFVYTIDGLWRDAAYDSTKPADTVYYGSAGYFSLAASTPAIIDYLSVGNQAAFNYGGQNYVVLDTTTRTAVKPDPQTGHTASADGMIRVTRTPAGIRFQAPGTVTSGTLFILSTAGAVVRCLPAGDRATVQWDGRNASGQRMPSGMYVARWQSRGQALRQNFSYVR